MVRRVVLYARRVRPASLAVAIALILACTSRQATENAQDAGTCTELFGVPNDKTGLDDTVCRPSCGCGDAAWTPEPWSSERVAELLSWTLLDAPPELTADPYPSAPTVTPGVCAVQVVDRSKKTYRLASFTTRAEAETSGAAMTHDDRCGVCSTLADLAVYASKPDLTDPVRSCGLDAGADVEKNVACLQKLGFTRPCAQIHVHHVGLDRLRSVSAAGVDTPPLRGSAAHSRPARRSR